MKCQFCNRENVDRVFYVNWMGTVYQVPVCTDCLYEALELAASSYLNGKFVVGGATPTCRLMMAREEMTGRMTDWREF